jgi:hypothetical protein
MNHYFPDNAVFGKNEDSWSSLSEFSVESSDSQEESKEPTPSSTTLITAKVGLTFSCPITPLGRCGLE